MAMPLDQDFALAVEQTGVPRTVDLGKIVMWSAAVIVPWTAIIMLARVAIDAIS